jgi:hypothetical protein
MKTKLLGLTLTLLAICIIFALLRLLPDKITRTPNSQTFLLISSVLDNFDALGLNNAEEQRLVTILQAQTNSLSINQKLTAFLSARTNNLRPLNDFNLSGGVFRDAWGTPLLFALTNGITNSGLIPLVNGHSRPFIVWSAGVNCSNEFGSGDDVLIIGR